MSDFDISSLPVIRRDDTDSVVTESASWKDIYLGKESTRAHWCFMNAVFGVGYRYVAIQQSTLSSLFGKGILKDIRITWRSDDKILVEALWDDKPFLLCSMGERHASKDELTNYGSVFFQATISAVGDAVFGRSFPVLSSSLGISWSAYLFLRCLGYFPSSGRVSFLKKVVPDCKGLIDLGFGSESEARDLDALCKTLSNVVNYSVTNGLCSQLFIFINDLAKRNCSLVWADGGEVIQVRDYSRKKVLKLFSDGYSVSSWGPVEVC